MMADLLAPFDVALKAAPHNLLATIMSGGQVIAVAPSIDNSGKQTTAAATASSSSGQLRVEPGPSPGRVSGAGMGHGATSGLGANVKFPQTTNIKVIEKTTKVGIPEAVIFIDGIPYSTTDSDGKLDGITDLSAGKHTISVDALDFESGEKEIYVAEPSGYPKTVNITMELSVIPTELPGTEEAGAGAGAGTAAEEAAAAAQEQAQQYGGGYYGGGYGYQQPPSYQPPSYEAPSYGAPSYGAPSYGGPTGAPQQPAQGLPQLPLPPLDWLQQFLLLPFTTIQTAMSATPMSRGGRCKK